MANQQAQVDALTTELSAANARAVKAYNEITAAITDLKAQVAAGGQLDFAALDAAVDAAGAAAQSLDDVVPDEDPELPPPPSGGFPNLSNTGVPAGTSLTVHTGDYHAPADAVVSNLHITGALFVDGPNVTVRRCQIDGVPDNAVLNEQPNLVLEDCTIGPEPTGDPPVCPSGRIFGFHDYTMRRCLLRGTSEGPAVFWGGNVLIEDSLIKLCWSQDDNHADGIQGVSGGSNVVLRHNTFDVWWEGDRTYIVAGIWWSDGSGDGVVMENNLWRGGGYVIRLPDGTGHTFTGNKVVDGAWLWGPVLETEGIVDWRDNHLVEVDTDYRVTRVVRELTRTG